ncbi:MAG: OmpA family protein [Gammaproteobacteria bacterium]
MNTAFYRTILFITGFLFAGSLAAADGNFYVAPGVQWMDFDDDTLYHNDEGPFLGLGYQFNDSWAAEVSTFDLDPRISGAGKFDLDHYKVDLLYDLDVNWGDTVTPFLVGGMGNTNFEGENDTLVNLGAGVKFRLTDNLYWRTSFRSNRYLGRAINDDDFGIDSALVFYFGSRTERAPRTPVVVTPPVQTPAPTPAVRDSDRDGVADDDDDCPNTPTNYAVDENGCPIPIEEVARFELRVNFDFDRSEVKSEYLPEIESLARFLAQYPDVIAELEGHTDSVGTEQYNQGLSDRRANAVRDVLINRFNVSSARVSAQGFGESQPIASNDTSVGRAQNRRTVTVILKTLQNYRPR